MPAPGSFGLFRLLGFEPYSTKPSFDLFASLVLPEDRKSVVELERLARLGLEFDCEFRIVRRDGRVRTIEAKGETLTSQSTNEVVAIGVISDTTAHAATEALAADLDIRYRSLVKAVDGTAWTVRKDGWAIETASGSVAGIARLDDGLGFQWHERVHAEDIEDLKETITEAARDNRQYQHEHRMRQPDGSYRWFRSRGVPLRGDNGEVREFIGITIEIQAERTLPEQAQTEGDEITGAQIRAARGLVNWSVQDLSTASGISASTIRRFETCDSFCHGAAHEEKEIRNALAKAGVKFYFHRAGKPAVAPR